MNWLEKISQAPQYFIGLDDGTYRAESPFGQSIVDWWIELEPRKDTIHVEGAHKTHTGLRQALGEIVSQYNLQGWTLSFGPGDEILIDEYLVHNDFSSISDLTFFHGTSLHRWYKIRESGLTPRNTTGVTPGLGMDVGVGSESDRIYLTINMNTAQAAAGEVSRRDGSEPVILRVTGLDEQYMVPDEDSREPTARRSLDRLGSIAYLRPIPPDKIELME